MEGFEMHRELIDERAVCVAWTGFTRLAQSAVARVTSRVKKRETRSIESVSGSGRQITGSCYFLLSIREGHDLVGYSGR